MMLCLLINNQRKMYGMETKDSSAEAEMGSSNHLLYSGKTRPRNDLYQVKLYTNYSLNAGQ